MAESVLKRGRRDPRSETCINIDKADQTEPVLRLGSSGLPVRRLQSRMTAVGFDTAASTGASARRPNRP